MAALNAVSKFDLKVSCIDACRGDVAEAERLYRFLAEDLSALPDFAPVPPTTFEQIRSGASQFFSFLKDNREDIAQAVSYVQTLRGGRAQAPAAAEELPPLDAPAEAEQTPATSNEEEARK
jgi:hypothetical protein